MYLGIYGKEPKRLLDIYIAICKEKEFEWTARTVWYREKLYNEMVEVENEQGDIVKEKSKKYHKKPFFLTDKNAWQSDEKDDSLQGVELLIKGIGVDLYFNEEKGLHNIVLEI